MIFPFTVFHPRCEVSHLSVIPIVREPHLGADQQDLFVVHDHPAVVDHILVRDWPVSFASVYMAMNISVHEHADITNDAHSVFACKNLCEHFP